MKRLFLLSLLVFLFVQAVCSQNSITEQIDKLLSDDFLKTSDASIAVYDLTEQKMIYSHGKDKLCRPASTEKLITVITALATLGIDYNFETKLCYTGTITPDSTLHGNLYLVGDFDPLFSEEDLTLMTGTIPFQGIRHLPDTLIADVSLLDSVYWGPGWCWDDTPYYYQPYLSPLMLNEGCIDITVTPTQKDSLPTVKCSPESNFYSIDNRSVCYRPEVGTLSVMRRWLENENVISISGNCTATFKEKMNMYHSDDFFLNTFFEQLKRNNLLMKTVKKEDCPQEAKPLFIRQRSIEEAVELALQESDNLCAEALFFHTAGINGNRRLGFKEGSKAIQTFIEKNIPTNGPYKIVDGCGISLYNYISADLLVQFLNYAYQHPDIYNMVLKHLPQSGISGTMKSRLYKTKAYRKIYAKTGTVTGICTLAGYAESSNGHQLAFVIFNQNILKPSLAREWQNKICTILCN